MRLRTLWRCLFPRRPQTETPSETRRDDDGQLREIIQRQRAVEARLHALDVEANVIRRTKR